MPDWQRQLEALLAALDVTLEGEGKPTAGSEGAVETLPIGLLSTTDSAGDAAPASDATEPSREVWVAENNAEDDADEVSAIRSEVEATMSRVVSQVHAGLLSRATRDDILFVLQALTRTPLFASSKRRPTSSQSALSQDWELTSAAAVLRFCRIVLRLADAIDRNL